MSARPPVFPPAIPIRGCDRRSALVAWRERRAAMLEHYAKTGNAAETARAFGITRQRVGQILRRYFPFAEAS